MPFAFARRSSATFSPAIAAGRMTTFRLHDRISLIRGRELGGEFVIAILDQRLGTRTAYGATVKQRLLKRLSNGLSAFDTLRPQPAMQ